MEEPDPKAEPSGVNGKLQPQCYTYPGTVSEARKLAGQCFEAPLGVATLNHAFWDMTGKGYSPGWEPPTELERTIVNEALLSLIPVGRAASLAVRAGRWGGRLLSGARAAENADDATRGTRLADDVFFHYTDDVGRMGIQGSELLRPGASGRTFLSPTRYSGAGHAQAELALPRTPTGYFEIPASRVSNVTAPTRVTPNFGQPGGGLECWTTCPINMSGLKWVPLQ